MSRSRKKVSVFKDKQQRWTKRAATKKLRKIPIAEPVSNGKAWTKKLYCSYDICDYSIFPEPDDAQWYAKGFRK